MTALRMLGLLPSLLLVACSSHLPPRAEAPVLLTQANNARGSSTMPLDGQWPAADWWSTYQDSTLDALMRMALAQAPSLATAESRFGNARQLARVTAASSGLRVDAEGSVARRRLSDNGMFPPEFLGYNWYTQADLGLSASYTFDFWHRNSDLAAAAVSEARAAQAERSVAALALSAAVAEHYFGWQADQSQLALLDEQLQLADRRKSVVQARVRAELEPADGLHSLDVELAALRSAVATTQSSAQLHRVVIAALLGSDLEQLPTFTARPLPIINTHLPEDVHVSLLARRADIVASRWRVEAAEQQLGAARAAFMPDLSINALAGLSSIDLGKLLQAGSAVPAITAAVRLPLFDSGLLQAQYGARASQWQLAANAYNETVVNAARDVATQTLALQRVGAQQAQAAAQLTALQQLVSSAEARQRQGLIDVRPVLVAQQSALQQRAVISQLEAAAVVADIHLQQALGGGYSSSATTEPQP